MVLLLIVSVIDLQKKNKLLLVLTGVVFSYGVILFICKTGTSHKVYDLLELNKLL